MTHEALSPRWPPSPDGGTRLRLVPLIIFAAIISAPLATSAPICTPYIFARACADASAGRAVDADVFFVTSGEWRSFHAAAGPGGAGAGLHGYGFATGPLDLYAGATPAGPYAGAFFCVGLWPYVPGACGDPISHVMRIASLLP